MSSDCGDVKKVFVKSKEEPKKNISGIAISEVAAEKIKTFLEAENKSTNEYGLRICVKKDGCSGNSYDMSLEEIKKAKKKEDKIFSKNGSTVMIEKTSYIFVIGSELNYIEALSGSGFTLNNPNTKRTCACGSSFSV